MLTKKSQKAHLRQYECLNNWSFEWLYTKAFLRITQWQMFYQMTAHPAHCHNSGNYLKPWRVTWFPTTTTISLVFFPDVTILIHFLEDISRWFLSLILLFTNNSVNESANNPCNVINSCQTLRYKTCAKYGRCKQKSPKAPDFFSHIYCTHTS